MLISRAALPAIAAALGLFAAPAEAAPDLTAEQVQSAVRFGLPSLFEGYRATCSASLAPSGYVTRNASRLAAKFTDGADQHWPAAREVFLGMGDEKGMDPEIMAQMPDEALKPFVAALLQQMVAGEIKPEQCGDVERGLELVDPLPADNIAGLVGFIVEMAEADDRAEADAAEQ